MKYPLKKLVHIDMSVAADLSPVPSHTEAALLDGDLVSLEDVYVQFLNITLFKKAI